MVPIFQPPHTIVSGLKPMVGCRYWSRVVASTVVEDTKFISMEGVGFSFYSCGEPLRSVSELYGLPSGVSEPSSLVLKVLFSFALDHFARQSSHSPWTIVLIVVVIVAIRSRSLRTLFTQRKGEGANSDSRSHHIFEALPAHPRHHRFTPFTNRSIWRKFR